MNQLFNEFQDEEGKSIIGKSLLDENYVMQGGRNRNYMNEANQVLGQLKLTHIRNTIKEIEAKIKSIDSSSPEILEMLNTQQKLRREQMQIENSMKTL